VLTLKLSALQVINGAASSSKYPAALTSPAHAAAAGTCPTLPTWLFGFACGSAAASAMAYNYLKPQPAAAAAAEGVSRQSFAHYSALAHAARANSSSSRSIQVPSSRLTDINFPGSVSSTDRSEGSSSSRSGDSSSSSSWSSSLLGGVAAGLDYLSRLGAASAHGACRTSP
jgi:hypothetical protein